MRFLSNTLAFFLLFSVSLLLFWSNCATPSPPGGGLKDSIPPILMATSVLPNTTSFDEKRVTFFFSENITTKNVSSEIIVNPYDKDNKPEIFYEANRLVFFWKDPLLAQTTYSISLGESVYDNNEGNKIEYPIYFSFSTGNTIDTSILYGTTVVANTGLPDSTILVTLYKDLEDSAVMLKSPTYKTFVDTAGKYVFYNLQPGTYRLYAMKDKSNVGKYLSKKQLFGFADNSIIIDDPNEKAPRLRLFSAPQEKKEKAPSSSDKKEIDSLSYTMTSPKKLTVRDTMEFTFNKPIKQLDSSKICLQLVSDSLPVKIQALSRLASKNPQDTTLTQLYIDAALEKGKKYTLFLWEGFVVDAQDSLYNKTDSVNITTYGEEKYGSAEVIQNGLNGGSEVLVRIYKSQAKTKIIVPFFKSKAVIPNLLAGEYTVDLLIDENRNGKWDYGSFFGVKSQPEEIVPLEKKLKIKEEENTTYVIDL